MNILLLITASECSCEPKPLASSCSEDNLVNEKHGDNTDLAEKRLVEQFLEPVFLEVLMVGLESEVHQEI